MKKKDKSNNGSFKWVHENMGTNYRITELQSAIGRSQLKKLGLPEAIKNKPCFEVGL